MIGDQLIGDFTGRATTLDACPEVRKAIAGWNLTTQLVDPPRQWVDRSGAAYNEGASTLFFESHPRQWVDRSGAAYNEGASSLFFESRPRQWVDRSRAAYNEGASTLFFESHPRQRLS